ncbi:MAG: DUF6069 family protein [Thermoflexales bacterium]|nr:DUF6069 family protein [Thermoflexales bacterium]MDW8318598.1 DUF6069 family protein [Anaerolineae bacterium]
MASSSTKVSSSGVWKAGGLAAVASAAVNAVLYFLGRAIGSFPDTALNPMGRPVDLFAVVLLSVMSVLAGTLVYWLLASRMDRPRANRLFTIIAIVVVVVMIPSPFFVQGAPVSQIVIMEIMHLVAAAAAIFFLTRR